MATSTPAITPAQKAYALELRTALQQFIDSDVHSTDGVLIIDPKNCRNYKIVYIGETIRPDSAHADWNHSPLVELMLQVSDPDPEWKLIDGEINDIAAQNCHE